MNELFAGVESTQQVEEEKDIVGRKAWESEVYPVVIKQAYFRPSVRGAIGLHLTFEDEKGGTYKEAIWITNRNKQTFYVDKKTQEQKSLPGFLQANTLAQITSTGELITKVNTEKKLVSLYNKEANAEIPTQVDMVVDMVGKSINVGIIKQIVDKTTQQGDVYVPTGETREENTISKFFTGGDVRLTASELKAKNTEEDYVESWLKSNKGRVIDKSSKTKPAPGAGGATSGASSTPSLF